jgi:ferredoxin
MKSDEEGFLHPEIDESKCVNCGLCAKVCPVLVESPSRKPLAVYAAKAKDDELRMKSSSGGVFSLLARQVISEGGIVFGAGFDHDD